MNVLSILCRPTFLLIKKKIIQTTQPSKRTWQSDYQILKKYQDDKTIRTAIKRELWVAIVEIEENNKCI